MLVIFSFSKRAFEFHMITYQIFPSTSFDRLSLLAKAQKRLAKLDELRQAAKTGAEMRLEKEREALGTRVESRVQQAKANRMRLLNAYMQRRAAAHERTARSLVQRIIQENKYKECVQLAIYQKRTAAEKKRMGLLEAERKRAQARVMQARRVAKTVCSQRESERRKMKEQLENRLQRVYDLFLFSVVVIWFCNLGLVSLVGASIKLLSSRTV